jgi:hypothetical protein
LRRSYGYEEKTAGRSEPKIASLVRQVLEKTSKYFVREEKNVPTERLLLPLAHVRIEELVFGVEALSPTDSIG